MSLRKIPFLSLGCSILLIFGCSTTKNVNQEPEFYPPAPEQPRLQFLTSFSSSLDIIPPASPFQTFILGKDTSEKHGINKPYGLAVHGSNLYVCDTMSRQVHVLDLENRSWEYLGKEETGPPINIAVDSNGIRYITDPTKKAVQIYDPSGHPLKPIEGDNMVKPTGIAVSADRIFVADSEAKQVHVYEKSSQNLLFSVPRDVDADSEKLYLPTNITTDKNGNIYVSDSGAFCIRQYDPEGNYLRSIGTHGKTPGTFARNKGVAVDRNGILYVVDASFQNIQMFNQNGELLLFFGSPADSKYPLILPAGVAIDYNNVALFQKYAEPSFKLEYLVFVSNQYGPRKVSVYGFGQMMQP